MSEGMIDDKLKQHVDACIRHFKLEGSCFTEKDDPPPPPSCIKRGVEGGLDDSRLDISACTWNIRGKKNDNLREEKMTTRGRP